MTSLIHRYRVLLEQGFMPICVADSFRIEALVEATLEAGAKAVEITCRRPNALAEIQAVRRYHPDLLILVGSLVDDGPMLAHLQRRQPYMPSIAQLVDAGVDGIVSAMPLRLETISRLSSTHLIIPGVETLTEAVTAIESGAHLVKLFTADLLGGAARVRRLTSAPTHGLVPLFVTGGITHSQIEPYLQAGAVMLGSGWDILLGEHYATLQDRPHVPQMSAALRSFLERFQRVRHSADPTATLAVDDNAFLRSRAHYVPQAWIGG